MAQASTEILKIEFDLTDPDITICRVTFAGHGDVPINALGGIREKTFPARKSCVNILTDDVPGYLLW